VPAHAVLSHSAAPSPEPSTTAPKAPEEPPADRLYLVAEVRAGYSFIPGKGGAFLIGDGSVIEFRGEDVVRPRGFFDGLQAFRRGAGGTLEGFGGRYPDHVYAEVAAHALRGTVDYQVHHLSKGTWSSGLSSGNDLGRLIAVSPFGGGFVAVMANADRYRIDAGGAASFEPRPAPKDAKNTCNQRMGMIESVTTALSGEVITTGPDCDTGATSFEVFPEKGGASTAFHVLESVDVATWTALSGEEIWVAGFVQASPAAPEKSAAPSASAAAAPSTSAAAAPSAVAPAAPAAAKDKNGPKTPYLAVLERGRWSPRAMPIQDQPITAIDIAPDGTLWAASGGAVWRRPRGKAWESVPMTDSATVKAVYVGSASDVWAWTFGEDKAPMRIFRSRAPKWTLAEGGGTPAPPLVPATAECATPFVFMYMLTEHASTDYDFPLTRQAMKGHPEFAGATLVMTEHNQFGAAVPTLEMGKKLAELIQSKVKGQKPQVVCLKPRIQAQVPFEI
jgi:hypothetical protein